MAFDPAVFDKIVDMVRAGMTASAACRKLDASRNAFNHYISTNAEAWSTLLQARQVGTWAQADDMLDIADEIVEDQAAATRQRTRIDTRKWIASKLLPAVFGDRVEVNHTHRIDYDAARAAALKRLRCDTTKAIEGQVIERAVDTALGHADNQSVVPLLRSDSLADPLLD